MAWGGDAYLVSEAIRIADDGQRAMGACRSVLCPICCWFIFLCCFAWRAGGGVSSAFLRGALFGLVCYATYDLTNWATIRDWPVIVSVVDMVWGAVMAGSVSALAVLVVRSFFG